MYRALRLVFFGIVILFPIADLLMSYLYHLTGVRQVIVIRYCRDLGSVGLAFAGFSNRKLPYQMQLAVVAYGIMLAVYSLVAIRTDAIPLSLIVSSAGTLIIPVSLTLAGFAAIRTRADLDLLMKILIGYGVATALFGLWDIHHTPFWTDMIGLGEYIQDVKGIPTGFQPDVLLPWNFIGFNDERRAAGLLAAPLAQGFFLAVVGVVGFAWLRRRSLPLATALSLLCFYGVQLSATRGAILALVVASGIYFVFPRRDARANAANLGVVLIMALVFTGMFAERVRYTINAEDGSTLGHVHALDRNIGDLFNVALAGGGVGTAGAETASVGIDIQGGGEGALFSVAYQLGVPGALVLIWYFALLFGELYAQRHAQGTMGELARALCAMFLGVATSMFSSEHILTFSGMGAFWLAVGGYVGYARRNAVTVARQPFAKALPA